MLATLSCLLVACATPTQQPSSTDPAGTSAEPTGSSSDPPATQMAGEHSGVPVDRRVTDLSPAERQTLCVWWAETLGGVGRSEHCVECSGDACDDWTVTVSTNASCVEWLTNAQCDATVEQAEACAHAESSDLCAFPTECDPLEGC
jgi:hypothetical protein